MKYGEQFEKESVPQWSLYNIDYNSLKHHIKSHTTKDQATAIAIPGHQDAALAKFEDELYTELCRQHDRVDLFVKSKSDEVSRRLQHVSNQVRRFTLRRASSDDHGISPKQQRKLVKYEGDLRLCGDDIRALQRFVNAQVVAFRKLLKKYRKWTGSATLGNRFKDTVLSHPKSFVKQDFSSLQSEYEDLLTTLHAASPATLSGGTTPTNELSEVGSPPRRQRNAPTAHLAVTFEEPQRYWNEYDCGSEAGDATADEEYAIYINQDNQSGFPGTADLLNLFAMPAKRLNAWMTRQRQGAHGEQGSLLPARTGHYGTMLSSPEISSTDTEDDGFDSTPEEARRGSYGYASSEEFPTGYETHFASLPSVEDQTIALYREKVLFWGTVAGFIASLVLLSIAAILILTGRHKQRLEVDAGVTVGVMASLLSACAAVGMSLMRRAHVGWMAKITEWTTFLSICILNGMLLVLVVDNTAL